MADIKRSIRLGMLVALALSLTAFVGCSNSHDEAVAPVVDTVPPAIPDGVAGAVLADGAIALTWNTNTVDSDLQGYMVYRSDSPQIGFRPLTTQPVTSNSWSDAHVQAGHTYYYAVSARDVSRNESGRSQTFQVTVPRGNAGPRGFDSNG